MIIIFINVAKYFLAKKANKRALSSKYINANSHIKLHCVIFGCSEEVDEGPTAVNGAESYASDRSGGCELRWQWQPDIAIAEGRV
jgi:hypothetical protein